MPKPEYNDLYLQLLQVKAQNSKMIYELLSQKQGWWQKNYGSVVAIISIISSYLLAHYVSKSTFKNQRALENDKKVLEKIKDNTDRHTKIYSNLVAIQDEYHATLTSLNICVVEMYYYKWCSRQYSTEKQINYCIKNEDENYEMHFKLSHTASQLKSEFLKNIAEYLIVINNSKELRTKMKALHDPLIEYKSKKPFTDKLNIDELGDAHDAQLKELRNIIDNDIIPKYEEVCDFIFNNK